MSNYVVFETTTGTLRRFVTDLVYVQADESYQVLPSNVDPEFSDWNPTTRSFSLNLPRLKAFLLDVVKRDSERRSMMFMSEGGAKKYKLARKAEEINALDSLGGILTTAIIALSADTRTRKFGYAIADATSQGDMTPTSTGLVMANGIIAAVNRFKAGADAANAKLQQIEAEEQRVCKAIRAATSATAARAAAASASWPAI
jgi:hypothetical protein